jgi:hypothetical protein
MASALSLEYLQSIEGAANGLATLDATTKVPMLQLSAGVANGLATLDAAGLVPESQLPTSVINPYKGEYADEATLIAAHPTGVLADYAYNDDTMSFWYWNAAVTIAAWVNQEITAVAYALLTADEKAVVPYIIII